MLRKPLFILHTFGQIELRRAQVDEGQLISMSPQHIALLIYLAAQPFGQRVRREELLAMFWPKYTGDPVGAALNSLQRDLGEGVVECSGNLDICLAQSAVWCDLAEFGDRLASGDYEAALALYRGTFLKGFALPGHPKFDEWSAQIRQRTRRDAATAAERLASASVDERAKIRWSLCAAEFAPYKDDVVRSLLSSLATEGESVEAVAAFERYAQRFAGEDCRKSPVLGKRDGDGDGMNTRSADTSSSSARVHGVLSDTSATPCAPQVLAVRGALPAALTPLVGRVKELHELRSLLDHSRLVSVVGPGGIGKSRLVAEAAREVAGNYRDGVAYVPLASLQAPDNLPTAIAAGIGLVITSDVGPEQRVQAFMRAKNMLLVLDNFEHLINRADLLFNLLEAAPELTILLSSRERLAIVAESVLDLWGLTVPPEPASPDQILEAESAQLFLQCARCVSPRFSPGPAEMLAIALICRQLDGFPLGIELTAAWVRHIDLLKIADELTHDPDAVTSAPRAVSPRQGSLRAAFEHSWSLLGEAERMLLKHLSVFNGSFSLDAVSSVTGTTFKTLSALCDKSLIRSLPGHRYEFPRVLRQYASEKLVQSPEEMHAVEQKHADYYLALPLSLERHLELGDIDTIHRLSRELENIRAAFRFSLDHHGIERIASCAPGLYHLWETLSYFQEGYEAFRNAATLAHDRNAAFADLRLTLYQGVFALRLGWYTEATVLLERASVRFNETEDKYLYAFALVRLGIANNETGNFARAEVLFRESLEVYRARKDNRAVANTLMHLGTVAFRTGRIEEAEFLFIEALMLRRYAGDLRGIAQTLSNLAILLELRGSHVDAQARLDEALQYFERCGDKEGVARAIHNMGVYALNKGDLDLAEYHSNRSRLLIEEIGSQRLLCFAAHLRGLIALKRGNIEYARSTLLSSLKDALSFGDTANVLSAVLHLGEVARKQENNVLAGRLINVVLHHPNADELTRIEAQGLLEKSDEDSAVLPTLSSLDDCVEQLLQTS